MARGKTGNGHNQPTEPGKNANSQNATTPNRGPFEAHTPKKVQNRNCTYLVLNLLRDGIRPSQIWKHHGLTERQVKYVLQKLKACGVIRRVGYGTWDILETGSPLEPKERRYKIIHRVAPTHTPPKGTKPDDVRGHGVVVTLKIPRFENWSVPELREILEARKIRFTDIPQGLRIAVGNVRKVWFTNKPSIVYYFKKHEWYGEKAPEVTEKILEYVIATIQRTERMLGINTLKINGLYKLKFSRRHYSLIKNGLAKMYDSPERKKLFVRDGGDLWLLVDNSYNLHELEAVKADKAPDDNLIVQNFFNGLRHNPITPEFVLNSFAETAKQIQEVNGHMGHYSKHLNTHVQSIRDLDSGVNNLALQAQENAKTTATLREAVNRLSDAMKGTFRPVDSTPKPVERLVKKTCELCIGEFEMKPKDRLCDECKKILGTWRRPTRYSTLNEYS